MNTRKHVTREPEEPAEDPATQTIVVPATQLAPPGGDLNEYEIDGNTYLLSDRDAELRGAKAVSQPRNKAVTPNTK